MPKSYFRVRAVVAEPLRQKFDYIVMLVEACDT
jgi:hypothetical protein